MAYLMAVDGEPDQAVADTVRRFIRGEVRRERHTFLPSAAEFAIEVRNRAGFIAIKDRMASRPPKTLPPPEKPISTEERAKVAALIGGLAKRIAAPTDHPVPADPMADPDALAKDTRPIRVSDALIGKLNTEAA